MFATLKTLFRTNILRAILSSQSIPLRRGPLPISFSGYGASESASRFFFNRRQIFFEPEEDFQKSSTITRTILMMVKKRWLYHQSEVSSTAKEVDIILSDGTSARAAVPSEFYEAIELRDVGRCNEGT